jgi:hypothetical protein
MKSILTNYLCFALQTEHYIPYFCETTFTFFECRQYGESSALRQGNPFVGDFRGVQTVILNAPYRYRLPFFRFFEREVAAGTSSGLLGFCPAVDSVCGMGLATGDCAGTFG